MIRKPAWVGPQRLTETIADPDELLRFQGLLESSIVVYSTLGSLKTKQKSVSNPSKDVLETLTVDLRANCTKIS